MAWLKALFLVLGVTLIMGGMGYVIQGQSITLMGIPLVMASAGLCLLLNLLVFIPAAMAKTEKYFDLTGSLNYLILMGMAIFALGDAISLRATCLALMVCICALRLGNYLMRRIYAEGKDGRFDEMKQQATDFIIPWVLQALWVFLTSLAAVTLIATHPKGTDLIFTDILGGALWFFGFLIEAIADAQKSAFRKDPNNAGQFIKDGLWRWSQHPNYFGEILLWTGIFVIGAGFYEGTQWLAVISPIFIYLLLTKISGINLLDERAKTRWGNSPEYQSYKQKTAVLFPRPPKA
jgi:steroid 5-alpha reductase family enzyme